MPVQTKIQLRRGTSAEWSAATDALSQGELGYDLTLGKVKIGDGSSLWSSLPWATLVGSDITGTSGVKYTYSNGAATISVTGLTASYISDFNSTVSGLLPVKNILAGTNISVSENNGSFTISTNGLDTNTVKDTVGGMITGVSGIKASYDSSGKVETLSVTGLTSSYISDFSTAVGNAVSTEIVGGQGIQFSYNSGTNTLTASTTGVSYSGHTHSWSDITDASAKASLSELAYLSGVTAGTASASRALVVDSNKDLSGIRALTTTGDVTVGGNLTIQGTTTTVNSTTVNIGDNIIRVNTSGLTTGGMEVYDGSSVKNIVWNTVSNRWEFSGGNVYTSGYFVGNLSGNANTVTNGVYTTDTGTVTSTMIADNTIVNADINSAAAIAYSKLNLSNSIVNADIGSSAAIAYSKLSLSNSIVNADISSSAAIADSKLATISTAGKVANSATTATNTNTASAIVARDASGNFSAGTITANLNGNSSTVTNGVYTTDTGTVTNTMLAGSIAYSKLSLSNSIVNSDISSSAAIAYSKLNLTSGIVNSDISATAAIAYSKLNLSSSISNSDIASNAAISVTKLASSGLTLGTTILNLGTSGTVIDGLTRISGVSAASPTRLYYCVIDGGSP